VRPGLLIVHMPAMISTLPRNAAGQPSLARLAAVHAPDPDTITTLVGPTLGIPFKERRVAQARQACRTASDA
jgi:hypothetical protein